MTPIRRTRRHFPGVISQRKNKFRSKSPTEISRIPRRGNRAKVRRTKNRPTSIGEISLPFWICRRMKRTRETTTRGEWPKRVESERARGRLRDVLLGIDFRPRFDGQETQCGAAADENDPRRTGGHSFPNRKLNPPQKTRSRFAYSPMILHHPTVRRAQGKRRRLAEVIRASGRFVGKPRARVCGQ